MIARDSEATFISFEGMEGSGKSTQVKRLAELLSERGVPVVSTWEPGGSRICNRIREILLNPDFDEMDGRAELLLYLASRAQHVAEVIKPALNQGSVVLCDRYFDSTLAYQGFGRGIDLEKILEINAWATDAIVPDLTLFLDLPVEEGLERGTAGFADRLERENIEFHRRIRAGYMKLAEMYPDRIKKVDADRLPEEVHQDILAQSKQILGAMI